MRLNLVPHLRDDFILRGCRAHLSRLVDRVCQRLLAVNVFAELHRGESDRRVHVIGRRDNHGIERLVVRIVEQLAIVEVLRCR